MVLIGQMGINWAPGTEKQNNFYSFIFTGASSLSQADIVQFYD